VKRPPKVSHITDDDLRAAFRLRAAGMPRPGMRQRIRLAAGLAGQPRTTNGMPTKPSNRPLLVRFGAVAGIAALVFVASLIGVGRDDLQDLPSRRERPNPDQAPAPAVATRITDAAPVDDDEDDDDEGDDDEHEGDDDDEDDDATDTDQPEEDR
jgi:hypothetical protein